MSVAQASAAASTQPFGGYIKGTMMKYYIYVSDSKVDMLLSQIPHEARKKIATEFKFDLKLLGASRKAETESEDDRFQRLAAVVAFIDEYGNVGSVDEPDEYVRDEMPMRWGPYGPHWYRSREDAPLVYFGGSTDRTIVGLGGSSKHVIGNAGPSGPQSQSLTPLLISYLEAHLGLRIDNKYEDLTPLGAVQMATTQMKGPEQRLEFLAKGNG